jgi:hypothetical protein
MFENVNLFLRGYLAHAPNIDVGQSTGVVLPGSLMDAAQALKPAAAP